MFQFSLVGTSFVCCAIYKTFLMHLSLNSYSTCWKYIIFVRELHNNIYSATFLEAPGRPCISFNPVLNSKNCTDRCYI